MSGAKTSILVEKDVAVPMRDGARLMADSVVIGPAVIGENCEIQSEAVVHESILWADAKIGRGALVEQAVVAAKAVVSPGVEVRGSIVLDSGVISGLMSCPCSG